MAHGLRGLPPIPKKEMAKIKRPEKISQTALGHFNECPRSALLYWKYKGGHQSAPMLRGELFHRFVEEAVKHLVDEGETEMPPEAAKDRMMAMIEESGSHLPENEQNACRAMAWNWGRATVIDPDAIVGVEEMIELELGDWTIRGKLDFAEIGPFGALVRDYKTAIQPISQDDAENAKSFQGKFYALLLLYGIPEGDSLPLGTGLNDVRVEITYPRWINEAGNLLGREVVWDRDQLLDFKRSIELHLKNIDKGFETGDWPALEDEVHCRICPARHECPLPDHVVPVPNIGTLEEAQNNALAWHLGQHENTGVKAGVKAFCIANGLEELPYDPSYALAFQTDVDGSVKFLKRKRKEPV